MRTSTRSLSAAITASIFAFGALTAYSPAAYADNNGNQVSPSGKGIVGGALLGAEAVTIVESLAGAKPLWAYGVGAVVGAAGGGVGGYFVEQNSSDGKAPVYMLAVGVGLLIPAIVLTLNATRYEPTEYATEDKVPTNAPIANPGVPGASVVAPAGSPASPAVPPPPPAGGTGTPAPVPAPSGAGATPPLSLFDMNGGSMRMGLPIPEVRPVYTTSELRQYGVAQQTEVRMPLVKITF